jgi:hypothetical protein
MKNIGLKLFELLQNQRTKLIIEGCYVLPEIEIEDEDADW